MRPRDVRGVEGEYRFDALPGAALNVGMLHPWSAVTWTWRVLRGHSVTFAVLFACALLGFSIIAAFRRLLSELGAPWYAWLLVPIIALVFLAKKEVEWIPELETRKKWARRIFFGSILVAVLVAFWGPERKGTSPAPAAPRTRFHKAGP